MGEMCWVGSNLMKAGYSAQGSKVAVTHGVAVA